jgi:hypothetical protein
MESGFAARVFAPKGTQSKPPPLPDQFKAQLAIIIKKELLKPHDPAQILLEAPNQKPLAVSCKFVNHTAGIATWLRNPIVKDGKIINGEGHAISLLLTGIDKSADDKAIDIVASMTEIRGVKKFTDEARKELRPIIVTLCHNFEISIDQFFVASMEMFAQAFFDQFGAQGDKREFDRHTKG